MLASCHESFNFGATLTRADLADYAQGDMLGSWYKTEGDGRGELVRCTHIGGAADEPIRGAAGEKGKRALEGKVVCSTNIKGGLKDVVVWLVEALGGTYKGDMKKDRTTHLAAVLEAGAPSEKIHKALKWGIQVVSPAYLEACAVAGRQLPSDDVCFAPAKAPKVGGWACVDEPP
ncbi:hypothetical protein T484DRAFT_1885949, partial [Baffinella frigidus]